MTQRKKRQKPRSLLQALYASRYEQMLRRAQYHVEEDLIVQGHYGAHGQGIFQGGSPDCHAYDIEGKPSTTSHRAVRRHYGIPDWVVVLQEIIFEGLPAAEAPKWHLEFANALRDNPYPEWDGILYEVGRVIDLLTSPFAVEPEEGKEAEVLVRLRSSISVFLDIIEMEERTLGVSAFHSSVVWTTCELLENQRERDLFSLGTESDDLMLKLMVGPLRGSLAEAIQKNQIPPIKKEENDGRLSGDAGESLPAC